MNSNIMGITAFRREI